MISDFWSVTGIIRRTARYQGLYVFYGTILNAGAIAQFLTGQPFWMLVQRWIMGTVVAGLALSMAVEAQK
jgi:hypothetical protein